MFNKVLVADDFDGMSMSIKQILKKWGFIETDDTKYCDDAYLKIKKAVYDNIPYNLLICDLNFKTDHRNTKLKSGEELILEVKKIQPDINIIVFSDEVKSFRIKTLFNDYNINAFVYKGRNSIIELEKAVQNILSKDEINPSLKYNSLNHKSLIDIREYDISLLKLSSYGYSLEEISKNFENFKISPNSISSIEKCINRLRIQFNAKNKVHLISIAKDIGLI